MKRIFDIVRNSLSGFIIKISRRQIIIAVLSVIILCYFGFSIIAPARKINQLNRLEAGNRQNAPYAYPRIIEHPEFFDLNKNKAFRESRLMMAKSDSIGLSVNLQDSIVALEIKGIPLHQVKISRYKASRLFRAIDNRTYMTLFSSPLRVELQNATIKKEPVIYKQAPKDTIEAEKSLFLPDTTKENQAYISLTLNHGFRLFIEQENARSLRAVRAKIAFRAWNCLKQAWVNLHHMLRFKIPPYSPVIKISIPGNDDETIYHALPENAMVSIKI